MKRDSEYFKALGKVIKCVESNAAYKLTEEFKDQACKDEIREMRLKAFNGELLYHQINKRFYMSILQRKRGEAAF